jgi:hypothetical protein
MSTDEPEQKGEEPNRSERGTGYHIHVPDASAAVKDAFEKLSAAYIREQQENRTHNSQVLWWNKATFWAVFAYTAATFCLLILSYCNLREIQSSSAQFDEAIRATNRLADEAKRSADNAIKTAERQLRAYIGFEDIKFYPLHDLITIYILNGGQTPAYNVHCRGMFHDIPINQVLPQGFDYPEPPDATIALGSGTFITGHKEPAGISLDKPLIARMISAKDKIISLFYYGHCDYEDVFEVQRSSPFCFQYLPDFHPPDRPDSPFINCPEHNTPGKGK